MYIILAILVLIILLVLVLAIKTANFKIDAPASSGVTTVLSKDRTGAVEKLSKAVRVKTISNIDYTKVDWNEFEKYVKLMEELYPLVHSKLVREFVNGHSLVYQWTGKDSKRKPILVTAHMDVVPVEKGTEQDWKYGPFSGEIAEGYVWGRGTLDTKIHMITALEAVELSLKEGFVPERDIYLAFGHDEEVGGKQGAIYLVEHFKKKGIQFEYLIDEGGCVTDGTIKDIKEPLALIGIAEKGFANIKISVSGDGGHSSMPPRHSALGTLAKVMINLENNQCKLELTKPVEEFLMKTGPAMNRTNKLILANLWLFKGLFMEIFSGSKSGNAMLRTTTAVTMAEASMQANVLPQKAVAVANFRIRHGETGEGLIRHIREVNKGLELDVEILQLDEPSAISSSKTEGYGTIEKLIKELYSDAIIAPYVMLGGSDARKYEPVCDNMYRFTPYRISNDQLGGMHGTNESISVDNINRCTEFFYRLYRRV